MSFERKNSRWILGVTGASGMKYALRLLDILSTQVAEVHVVFSEAGLRVLNEEEGIKVSVSQLSAKNLLSREQSNIHFYNPRDIGATIASGSALFEGMVIAPCTMGTLAAVAQGHSQNLLHRAADVTLKEGRRLVIVPRETPLSSIHLQNMLTLSQMGVRIVPAMPGFYHQPSSIAELVDMQVMKILDQMGLHLDLVERWNDKGAEPEPASLKVVSLKTDSILKSS